MAEVDLKTSRDVWRGSVYVFSLAGLFLNTLKGPEYSEEDPKASKETIEDHPKFSTDILTKIWRLSRGKLNAYLEIAQVVKNAVTRIHSSATLGQWASAVSALFFWGWLAFVIYVVTCANVFSSCLKGFSRMIGHPLLVCYLKMGNRP